MLKSYVWYLFTSSLAYKNLIFDFVNNYSEIKGTVFQRVIYYRELGLKYKYPRKKQIKAKLILEESIMCFHNVKLNVLQIILYSIW